MTEILLPVSLTVLLVLSLLSSLACYSLRGFSRSRLDDICRRKNRELRFGVILKKHEDALLAMELLLVVSTLGLASLLLWSLQLFSVPQGGAIEWPAFLGEWLLVVVLLVSAVGVIPWTISRVAGERFLYLLWPVLAAFIVFMRPVLNVLYGLDKLIHRLTGMQERNNGDESVISEEIRTVVDEGQREGVLESEARTMIHRVMELQAEDTAAIMTPRTDMNCISVDSTLEEARNRMLEAGHSRMPVIGESTDDIIGILYAKDLLKHVNSGNGEQFRLADIVREPFYVPETTSIANLLETMKLQRVHLAIVVDEYGGVAGLVTLEDVLEEIVGEIVDEYDAAEETGIHSKGPNVTEVEARVHIDDLNELFEFGLPEDNDYDTIGGFVFSQLGRIPEKNDSFTWNGLHITILEADKRKVDRLRIEVDQTLTAASPEDQ